MKKCFYLIIVLSLFYRPLYSQTNNKAVSFQSGFYSVTPDVTKKFGYKVEDKRDYYFINSYEFLPLQNIDTVYSVYDVNCKCYVIRYKFNRKGTTELLDFTKNIIQRKIGLVINNKLLIVATNYGTIDSGEMELASGLSKFKIDTLVKRQLNSIKKR